VIRVGILGATGYTGLEIVKILVRHPQASLEFATTRSHVGKTLADVFPVPYAVPLVEEPEVEMDSVDVVFCCLPAGAAMEKAAEALELGVKVVDLSADFRLKDADLYREWYKIPHSNPDLLEEAVYGLPELFRAQIKTARLIANPGCYPTSILLGLFPLLRENLASQKVPIIADSKSGVSGAGRSPSLKTHFVEANENLVPYNIGRQHRHWPEIEQMIQVLGGRKLPLVFSPHLLPVNRGILSTMYVQVPDSLTQTDVEALYQAAYSSEPFVWVLPEGQTASLAHAVYSNRCVISITLAAPGNLIVCSAIDNLIKGASGQAVQNMNLMFGLDETMGVS
jgi:N-acetyl-gamma-glutamyl-phosphate reductase